MSDDFDEEAPRVVDGVSLWATYDALSTYCEEQLAKLYGVIIHASKKDSNPLFETMKDSLKKTSNSYRKASTVTLQMKDEGERRLTQKIKELNATNRLRAEQEQVIASLNRELTQYRGQEELNGDIGGPLGEVLVVAVSIPDLFPLWEALPDLLFDGIDTFGSVLKHLCSRHGGHEAKGELGEYILLFEDLSAGAQFCLDLQEQLLLARWEPELLTHPATEKVTEGGPSSRLLFCGLRARVSVTYGKPLISMSSTGRHIYAGPVINHAIAINNDIGRGGETLIEQDAFNLLNQLKVLEKLGCVIEKRGTKDIPSLGRFKKATVLHMSPSSLKNRQFEVLDVDKKLDEKQRMNWWLTKVAVTNDIQDLSSYVQGQTEQQVGDVISEKEKLQEKVLEQEKNIEKLQSELNRLRKNIQQQEETADSSSLQEYNKRILELIKQNVQNNPNMSNLKAMDVAVAHKQSLPAYDDMAMELSILKKESELQCANNTNVSTLKQIIVAMHKKTRQYFYIIESYMKRVMSEGLHADFTFVSDWVQYDNCKLHDISDVTSYKWNEVNVRMHDACLTSQKEEMLHNNNHYLALYYSVNGILARSMLSLLQFVPDCLHSKGSSRHRKESSGSYLYGNVGGDSYDKLKNRKVIAMGTSGGVLKQTQASLRKMSSVKEVRSKSQQDDPIALGLQVTDDSGTPKSGNRTTPTNARTVNSLQILGDQELSLNELEQQQSGYHHMSVNNITKHNHLMASNEANPPQPVKKSFAEMMRERKKGGGNAQQQQELQQQKPPAQDNSSVLQHSNPKRSNTVPTHSHQPVRKSTGPPTIVHTAPNMSNIHLHQGGNNNAELPSLAASFVRPSSAVRSSSTGPTAKSRVSRGGRPNSTPPIETGAARNNSGMHMGFIQTKKLTI